MMRPAILGLWALILALLIESLAFLVESWFAHSTVSNRSGGSEHLFSDWASFLLLPENLIWFASMAIYAVGVALALWVVRSRWRPGLWGVSAVGVLVFVWSLWRFYGLFGMAMHFQTLALGTVNIVSVSLALMAMTTLMAAVASACITLPTARWLLIAQPAEGS